MASKPKTDLEKYKHHLSMADKHRAHADLIDAKLRTQGHKINTDYTSTGQNYSVTAAPHPQKGATAKKAPKAKAKKK